MKSFKKYLAENTEMAKRMEKILSIEESIAEDEKIYDVNEDGTLEPVDGKESVCEEEPEVSDDKSGMSDDDFYTTDNLPELLDEEEMVDEAKNGGTWGGEWIIDLDYGDEDGNEVSE